MRLYLTVAWVVFCLVYSFYSVYQIGAINTRIKILDSKRLTAAEALKCHAAASEVQ